MPRATCQYSFEWKILDWCGKFSKTMTGNPYRAFFLAVDERGEVVQLFFAQGKYMELERVEFLRSQYNGWLNYSPFEAPEDYSVSWRNVPLEAMERLVGERFPERDFVSERTGEKIVFPDAWAVGF
jgi:hypothetical protein